MSDLLKAARAALPGCEWRGDESHVADDTGMSIRVVHGGYRAAWIGRDCSPCAMGAAAQWLRDQVEARRDALDAALGQGWVPVGERLPEQGAAVLGWDGRMVHMVTLESDGQHWIDDGSASDTNVTHWRELPAPPKDKP